MSARALSEEMRERDVRIEAKGLTLHVDAPSEADTSELRAKLREHKRALIPLLESVRRKLEEAKRRGLVIRFAREPGYLSVHDPTMGDWHELLASSCPAWMLEDAKARLRRGGRTNR